MPPKQAQSSRARSNQASSSGTPGSISLERMAMDEEEAKGDHTRSSTSGEMMPDVPPPWRAPLSKTLDLGYPDYIPARPGFSQPEDRITEQNVKQGFQGSNAIALQTEGYSVHAPLSQRLKSTTNNAMESLSKLADEIMAVKTKSVPVIPKWTYKLPNRSIFNDSMRTAFIADLINPNFPLQRMAKSIPNGNGYRGEALLELLSSRAVPFERAAWLIQAVGAHEVVALRNRASTSTSIITPSDQYSIDLTVVYCTFLRKQLAEITLPQKPANAPPGKAADNKQRITQVPSGRPALPAKNLLADPQLREKWLAKWEYSLELIKWLMAKSLVHERTWSGWLGDQVAVSHLGQLGFVVALLNQYLDMVLKSQMMARAAVRACVEQLSQIRGHRHRETLSRVEDMLTRVIQFAFQRSPELLVCPSSWVWHEELLKEILVEARVGTASAFSSVKKRNDAMLLRNVPLAPGGSASNRHAMAAIQVLDSMDASSNLRDVYEAYFIGQERPLSKGSIDIAGKIQMLLNWSTGFGHLGPHRPYLCSSLLTIVKQDLRWTSIRKRTEDWLEMVIFDWLDDTATAMPETKFNSVGITIGDLTRVGLFSLGDYLRRQVARGIVDDKHQASAEALRFRTLLKHLPAFATAPALLNLRNRVLGGSGVSHQDQAAEVQVMRDEMTSYLSAWKDLVPVPPENAYEVSHDLPCIKAASRYVQVQLRMWTLPVALRTIGRLTMQGDEGLEVFARLMHAYEAGRGIASIHQILLRAIPTAGYDMLDSIIYTTMRHLDVWTAMDCLDSLSAAIFDRYFGLADEDDRPKHQSPMCWELAHKAHLTNKHASIVRDWLIQDPNAKAASDPAPSTLSTVQLIHKESDLAKVDSIARDLSNRFDHDPRFPAIVWRCAMEALTAAQQESNNHGVALSAVSQLLTVIGDLHDLKPSGGLRGAFAKWADQQAKTNFSSLFAGAPDTLADFLLRMITNRILMGKAILHHLILPVWLQLSQSRSALVGSLSAKESGLLRMSVKFCSGLFLSRGDKTPAGELYGLRTAQCFWAHTAAIFEDSSAMEELIQHLALLPLIETALASQGNGLGGNVAQLREGISALATFKKSAYRHLDALKDAFLTRRTRMQYEKESDTRLVEALLLIMTDNEDSGDHGDGNASYDWTNERAELSPWQWKRTVLELRLSLKRLSMRVNDPEDQASSASTEDFAATLLDRPLTNDQVALVEEAMKGIDPSAANVVLQAGINRLSQHLQHMVDIGGGLGQDTLDQVRTVSRVLAITLHQSRASGHQKRASAAGISDPSRYVHSLAALVKRLNEGETSKRSDILDICTLTLRLYLCMVGGTADIGTLAPSAVTSLVQSAFELLEINVSDVTSGFYKDLFSFVLDEMPREKRFVLYDKLLSLASSSLDHFPKEATPVEILEFNGYIGVGARQPQMTPGSSPWEALPSFSNESAPDATLGAANAVYNVGSVDLLAFKASLTGDRLETDAASTVSGDPDELAFEARPWEIWASERGLQGISIRDGAFARDWATGLLEDPPIDYHVRKTGDDAAQVDPTEDTVVNEAVGTTVASAIEIADDDEPVPNGKAKGKRPASPDPGPTDRGGPADGQPATRRMSNGQNKRPRVGSKVIARKATGGISSTTAKVADIASRKAAITANATQPAKPGRRKSSAAA